MACEMGAGSGAGQEVRMGICWSKDRKKDGGSLRRQRVRMRSEDGVGCRMKGGGGGIGQAMRPRPWKGRR